MPPNEQPSGRIARATASLVTNGTKLAGVAIGVHEAFWEAHPRSQLVALAALMIAGALSVERTLGRLIDKLFASDDQ